MAERLDRVLHGRLRDELLNERQFDSLLEAHVFIEEWRIDDNDNRPHTAHGDLTRPSSPGPGPSSNHKPLWRPDHPTGTS